MTNIKKLNDIFCEVFSVEVSKLGSNFDNNSVDCWDSVHQLSLVAALEETFDLFMDPEDIIACNSYEETQKVLRKYHVDL